MFAVCHFMCVPVEPKHLPLIELADAIRRLIFLQDPHLAFVLNLDLGIDSSVILRPATVNRKGLTYHSP